MDHPVGIPILMRSRWIRLGLDPGDEGVVALFKVLSQRRERKFDMGGGAVIEGLAVELVGPIRVAVTVCSQRGALDESVKTVARSIPGVAKEWIIGHQSVTNIPTELGSCLRDGYSFTDRITFP